MNGKHLVVIAAFALASTPVFAQQVERGWYAGLSLGQGKVKFDKSFPAVLGATASSVSKDETDTGYKLFVGHRFSRNFALEGGWTNFREFSATRNVTAPQVGSLRATVEASGFHLDAVGILPFASFSLFGKLGGIYTTTKTSLEASGAVMAVSPTTRTESPRPRTKADPRHK